MSRLLLTAAVLAVLVYAMVQGVRWLSPRIDQDIAGRVTTGLAEQGLLWADIDVEGRDVVLSGIAPDADSKARAVNVATRVFGVAKVQDNIAVTGEEIEVVSGSEVIKQPAVEVKPVKVAKDYGLTIVKDGEAIAFEGRVPDEASRDVLARIASNRYGEKHVDTSKLSVEDGAPAGWRSAVGAVLMHITNMEQANVVFSGNEVMVSGTVQDKEFSSKMESDVTQVLPKEYKVAFAVDVVTPTAVNVEPAAGDVSETAQAGKACNIAAAEKEVLRFGFDKADITDAHKAQLKIVRDAMVACEAEKMVLAGYTDVTGSPLYNKWLSQQRAEASMRSLMRDGVAKDRMRAVGYGDLYPVGDNKTKAGRAENRRVEFHAGVELPHAEGVVEAAKPKKVAAKPVEKSVAVKAEAKPVAEVQVEEVKKEESVSSSKISKPWWASKEVTATAVEVK